MENKLAMLRLCTRIFVPLLITFDPVYIFLWKSVWTSCDSRLSHRLEL